MKKEKTQKKKKRRGRRRNEEEKRKIGAVRLDFLGCGELGQQAQFQN